jgi:hypothetical protein
MKRIPGLRRTERGGYIADTAEAIEFVRLITIEKALQIRAETGISVARNMPTVKVLKQRHPQILTAETRTYAQAYRLWKAYVDKTYERTTA